MSDNDKEENKTEISLPVAVSKVADAISFLAIAVLISGLFQCNGAIVSGG